MTYGAVARLALAAALAAGTAACVGSFDDGADGGPPAPPGDGGGTASSPIPYESPPDIEAARTQYRLVADLQRFIFTPACASEFNNCHYADAYPELSSEAHVLGSQFMPCQAWRSEPTEFEDICEPIGDRLEIGGEGGFTATVGTALEVHEVADDLTSPIVAFSLSLDRPLDAATAGTGKAWRLLRGDGATPAVIQTGNGLDGVAGERGVSIAPDQFDPAKIVRGDPNGNGTFGDGLGRDIKPGDAANSYLVLRLLGARQLGEVLFERMPLTLPDISPVSGLQFLSPTDIYAVTSFINCLKPEDGPDSPIDFDCAANASNGR